MPEPESQEKADERPTSPETAEMAQAEQHEVAEDMAEEPDLPV